MDCRICGSGNTEKLGEVEYYAGYRWEIFDCYSCGCRYTKHDLHIYEWLHQHDQSIYGIYRQLAGQCKQLVDKKDINGLRQLLCGISKYKFIINSLENLKPAGKILEVGCSRGYLTSYFILAGYDVTGIDSSKDAISSANQVFGQHFHVFDPDILLRNSPYDVIYHVGTIGCVENPIDFTNTLLEMVKPGGQLLFNAPNLDSCCLPGQLWLDEAPPPDLVTLFKPDFWSNNYHDLADIEINMEKLPRDQSLIINIKKTLNYKWKQPIICDLDNSISMYSNGITGYFERLTRIMWSAIKKVIFIINNLFHIPKLGNPQPAPFGLFVTMTRK